MHLMIIVDLTDASRRGAEATKGTQLVGISTRFYDSLRFS